MELDDMKQAWQALDRRLADQQALNWQIYRDGKFDRMRRGLRPLVWGMAAQMVLGIAFLLLGVAFWTSHRDTLHWVICGVSVQAFGILVMAFTGRLISLLHGIDYSAPVLEIQQRLASVRRWRVKVEAPVFSTLGAVIWIPLLLMWFQWGVESDGMGPDVLVMAPQLVGIMAMAAGISLALTWGTYGVLRFAGKRRWLEKNFVGRSVMQAEAMLDEVKRFQQP
ncbi:hypothetical protein EYV96_07355 [Dyella terrae]|uniref:Serine/threonine protein kinase n=3 Tax=Dyella TaxID=231454 RepID=A0A4R0YWE7_9GAMM|nr:hypothetical protein [Dyella soli]TBR39992.1 hypothetical protein EYV96_07355 [Dyella terrae]TCI13795.1 hypothetical protein EZM97_03515 [Dyella soli]